MKPSVLAFLACCILAAGCSETGVKPGEPTAPKAPATIPEAAPAEASPVPEPPPPAPRPEPLDIGDVDSGIFIHGLLAPESASDTVTADYIETLRGTLSLTTITVKEPFPDQLLVRFELKARRNFPGRPVVIRARAYRGESEVVGAEYACVLGSDAQIPKGGPNQEPFTHAYTVNVLEGLAAIPDTLLVHGQADAWLMPEGTSETLVDPKSATSPDQVPLVGNPVRINFVKAEAAP